MHYLKREISVNKHLFVNRQKIIFALKDLSLMGEIICKQLCTNETYSVGYIEDHQQGRGTSIRSDGKRLFVKGEILAGT